jgi:hypothetical protein
MLHFSAQMQRGAPMPNWVILGNTNHLWVIIFRRVRDCRCGVVNR